MAKRQYTLRNHTNPHKKVLDEEYIEVCMQCPYDDCRALKVEHCPICKKIIEAKKEAAKIECRRVQNREASQRYYYKHRNDPELLAKKRANATRWAKNNPDKVRVNYKRYWDSMDPEKKKEMIRKYNEKRAEYRKRYYEEHKAEKAAYMREWKRRRKDAEAAAAAKREADRREAWAQALHID